MTVVARGVFSEPFAELAILLAACPAVQTELGTPGDATAALALIEYPCHVVDPLSKQIDIPKIVITDDNSASLSGNRMLEQEGSLYTSFFFNPGNDLSERDELLDHRNIMGDIVEQVMAKAKNPKANPADGFYFGVIEWHKTGTPTVARKPQFHNEFRYAELRFDWN